MDVLGRTADGKLLSFVNQLASDSGASPQNIDAAKVFFSYMDSLFSVAGLDAVVFDKVKGLIKFVGFFEKILIKLAKAFGVESIPKFRLGTLIQFFLKTPSDSKSDLIAGMIAFFVKRGGILGKIAGFFQKGLQGFSGKFKLTVNKLLEEAKKQKESAAAQTEGVLTEGIISSFIGNAFSTIKLILTPVVFLLEKILKVVIRFIWSPIYALCQYVKAFFEKSGIDNIPLVSGVLMGGFMLAGFFPVAGFFLALSIVTTAARTILSQAALADKCMKGTVVATYLYRGKTDAAVNYLLDLGGFGSPEEMAAGLEKTFNESANNVGQVG